MQQEMPQIILQKIPRRMQQEMPRIILQKMQQKIPRIILQKIPQKIPQKMQLGILRNSLHWKWSIPRLLLLKTILENPQ